MSKFVPYLTLQYSFLFGILMLIVKVLRVRSPQVNKTYSGITILMLIVSAIANFCAFLFTMMWVEHLRDGASKVLTTYRFHFCAFMMVTLPLVISLL